MILPLPSSVLSRRRRSLVSEGGSTLRPATPTGSTILFAGHSLVQTANGGVLPNGDDFGGIFKANWPGVTLDDYAGFGSMQDVWNLNSDLRNSAYNVAIVSEVYDPGGSIPASDSAYNQNTLQHWYWAGRAAQLRGAELVLYPVWSPNGRDIDADILRIFGFGRRWLEAKLGQRVWMFPANQLVRAMVTAFGGAIWQDQVHLSATARYRLALSYMMWSFQNKTRCPWVQPGDSDIDQMGWDILQAWQSAGFGGATLEPADSTPDPLPSPAPLPSHPLQQYFDSGTIVIYLDSDAATLNGSGQVTAIANRGAGGAAFDAPVAGAPIPMSGNALQMSASVGTPILATPASIDGVRLMWACSLGDMTSSMRFMGSANDEIRLGAIQAGTPNSAFLQFWSNRSGSGVSTNPTPRIPLPATGMHLLEAEVSVASQYQTAWQDGAQVATLASFPHSAFYVDRLGQGTGGANQFVGQLGGVLGVITGRPDTAAAIAAARSFWAARFGIVMS